MKRLAERVTARNYSDPEESGAFHRGYRHGWNGKDQQSTNWPNAYSAGYWEGRGDRHDHDGTKTIEYPVKSRFGASVYFTVAIWVWWWYGNEWNISLSMKRKPNK